MTATVELPAREHLCDTCGQPCQGGCEDYTSASLAPRHGCADYHACARAWWARKRRGR